MPVLDNSIKRYTILRYIENHGDHKTPISCRLNRELKNKLKQAAKNLNVNKTAIVRISLAKYLTEIDENK